MDRDRDHRRGYDRDRYAPIGGESYRPGRPSPPRERYRSPPRRGPPPQGDTYVPSDSRRPPRPRSRSPDYRRRSRSPLRGGYRGGENYRGRARSPIPARRDEYRDSFRDDYRARSPIRESRFRSPPRGGRDRSPIPLKRSREVSPIGSRGMRSPPPPKRERIASPPRRGRYDEYDSRPASRAQSPRRRGYSPAFEARRSPQPEPTLTYRPRSRSPVRRPERVDAYPTDSYRQRSPSPVRAVYSGEQSTTERSPYPASIPSRSPARRESPGPREREYGNGGSSVAPYRNGDSGYSRPPPTGPPTGPRGFSGSAMSPPTGPANVPISAHNRATVNPLLSAPSRPRGAPQGPGRGGYGGREHSYDYPPRRGSSQWSGRGNGPPPPAYSHGGTPTGPRGGSYRGSHNSTSTTYPRTLRVQNHLSDLPPIVPGGVKQPEFTGTSGTKIERLEDEARKLRELINAKEEEKRRAESEWRALEREASNKALVSDLAEQSLRTLTGEDVGGAAF